MAVAYGRAGATVVSVARTRSELEGTENIIRSAGGEVLTVPTDLSVTDEILRLRDTVLEHHGGVDILVNNAATSPWKTLGEMTVDEWDRTIAVNLRAPFVLAKAFMDPMARRGGGSVINVTSRSAEMGFVAEAGYCPSKYGLEGLTQCLALELQPFNIAVNSLNVSAPKGMRLKPTELTLEEAAGMPEAVRARYADVDSMVEAFAEAWSFLAFQDGDGVTGGRFSSRLLAEELAEDGWDEVTERHRRFLTKAVYEPYPFPPSVRYQTPEGGWEELRLE